SQLRIAVFQALHPPLHSVFSWTKRLQFLVIWLNSPYRQVSRGGQQRLGTNVISEQGGGGQSAGVGQLGQRAGQGGSLSQSYRGIQGTGDHNIEFRLLGDLQHRVDA